jgi:NTE family protein
MPSDSKPPDVLVLGGGGIVGEAWMLGVLVGIEEATGLDLRESGGFIGTSAGSIVAATLHGGVAARARLDYLPDAPEADLPDAESDGTGVLLRGALRAGRAAAGLVAPVALVAAAPGGAIVRRAALGRVPRGRRPLSMLRNEIDRRGARFDGRLLVSAVELESGRRIMFGAPGAPETTVGTAVEASCAIPGVFRPVEVDGRSYVDGGAWSPTNMDAARVGRGDRVLCLNPTGSLRPSRESPLGAMGPVSRAAAAVEALVLERRGARVVNVSPDADSAAAMGANLMTPGPRAAAAAAGAAQGRALRLP